ncbi:MAG: DapH/DapD/GlmU-related protein [bacterium]
MKGVRERFLTQGQIALGLGLRRRKKGRTLDVLFPSLVLKSAQDVEDLFEIKMAEGCLVQTFPLTSMQLASFVAEQLDFLQLKPEWVSYLAKKQPSAQQYAECDVVLVLANDLQSPINTVEEAFLKLQLLSQRLVKPHQLNLEAMFRVLHNLAWSNYGPILLEDIEEQRLMRLFAANPLIISHVDKIPYLVNYHVPSGVRIASGSQVRLGAYLGEGTTVMPAGYINFNAGTEGNAMVEGRVSAGVMVDKDTDIGGGASIMGTLSGGNQHVISIGANCLLGANSGLGISLGYGCTIAAGLYVYAGMKIFLLNQENEPINIQGRVVAQGENVVKAFELSGRDNMLFIQDSRTGQVLCKPNLKTIHLNPDLHQNH